MPPVDDEVRLYHMIDAAKEAIAFVRDKTLHDLEHDRLTALALVKCIEILGEAAARVSKETRSQDSAIPWLDMIDMRNRLIHAYFEIDIYLVWDTVTHDLPALLPRLEALRSKLPQRNP